jgi:hypothetical protein
MLVYRNIYLKLLLVWVMAMIRNLLYLSSEFTHSGKTLRYLISFPIPRIYHSNGFRSSVSHLRKRISSLKNSFLLFCFVQQEYFKMYQTPC